MRPMNMKNATFKTLFLALMVGITLSLTPVAFAAAPGVAGTTFNLTAQPAYLNQPDGEAVYSWGYGCLNTTGLTFLPAAVAGATCPTMQVPGPTLIVTEGQSITVNLTNQLPTPAGNTSILFPGFNVTATGGVTGLLTQEAAPGGTVTYKFTASAPGTHAYYSGTQGDLQIEMGLYGAIIVLPTGGGPTSCNSSVTNLYGKMDYGTANSVPGFPEKDFRLAHAAYDHPKSCYDREYLFQWAEMDSRIHRQALAQVQAKLGCTAGANGCSLDVQTEPYHPSYFLINGRSMPDLMDPNFAGEYPHQPYNGNPHMHPGELTLIRTIGDGRRQHPFHEHANHVRILARDGNLILSPTNPATNLASILMFNTDTTPGQSFDGIFYFTGRGLNWDPYGHHPADASDSNASLPCYPDANGYYTVNSTPPAPVHTINYYEWCQDHNKPLEVAPFGDVAAGGPVTLPDSNILTNGAWYGGSPYLGPNATGRATGCSSDPYANPKTTCGGTGSTPPSGTIANPPGSEAGFAFIWHSHNEREITTNNIFPGGMRMIM